MVRCRRLSIDIINVNVKQTINYFGGNILRKMCSNIFWNFRPWRWGHQAPMMATVRRAGESQAEGRFPWTRVNPLQPTGANAISGIWHSAFGSHSIVPVRVVTGTPKILAISKLAWPPLIAKLRNTCYRVTKVCEEAIKIYFADTRAHFLPKQLAT